MLGVTIVKNDQGQLEMAGPYAMLEVRPGAFRFHGGNRDFELADGPFFRLSNDTADAEGCGLDPGKNCMVALLGTVEEYNAFRFGVQVMASNAPGKKSAPPSFSAN